MVEGARAELLGVNTLIVVVVALVLLFLVGIILSANRMARMSEATRNPIATDDGRSEEERQGSQESVGARGDTGVNV